jgi:hypothetical protein
MSLLSERLSQAAGKNRELLTTLSKTDYAPPALKQNLAYIGDLQSQIYQTDNEIKKFHAITEQERKEHTKIRDSVARKYLHKLGGSKGEEKFKSKQEKEEREFMEAWQREREAQERQEALGRALEQAEQQKRSQEADKARHDRAQEELDRLYNSIFSGPTPDVPGEDEREHAVYLARDWYNQCQTALGTEKHAMDALQRANQQLSAARREMDDALSASNVDRFGGGALWDMMERDALSRGQVKLSECMRAMDDARRSQPAIPMLSEVNIDNGHFISDVLFDNIFTDMAQHDRIRNSTAQVDGALSHLGRIIGEQNGRVQQAQEQHWQASKQLEDARVELQRIRSEAFDRVGGSYEGGYYGEAGAAPPAYSAT